MTALEIAGMSDRAVYLGDGVWWQLTHRQVASGIGRGLPERIRPVRPPTISPEAISAIVKLGSARSLLKDNSDANG